MSKASIERIGDLHGVIAEGLIDKLTETEPVLEMTATGPMPSGKVKRTATSGDFANAIKFCNDNKVTADLGHASGKLGQLEEVLSKSQRRSSGVVELPLPVHAVNS